MAYTTIDDPSAYFQTKLYSGNGGTQSITLDGNSDLQPDWVWIKQRSNGEDHFIFDSVRGVKKRLMSNTKDVEDTHESLTSFNSDGFSLAGDRNEVNQSGASIVAWNWKKDAAAGFDIVSYTGNDTARTISHSLSAVPTMIIIKCRNVAKEWTVFTAGTGNGKFFELDGSTAVQTATNRWNDTSPTSSVFSLGVDSSVNASNQTYIAYLFAEKQGYSKFGSYTGNANANGTYVYTGFKPAYVLTKQTNSSDEPWIIKDLKRSPLNTGVDSPTLFASVNTAESNRDGMDFFSNGFKCRDNGAPINSGSYLYMAFAESPFVTSTGVPTTAQ